MSAPATIRKRYKSAAEHFSRHVWNEQDENVLYRGSELSVTESQTLLGKCGSVEELNRVIDLIRNVFISESGNPIQKPKTKKKTSSNGVDIPSRGKTNERKKEKTSQESAMEVFKRSEPEKAAIEGPNRSASEKDTSPLTVAGLNRLVHCSM